MLRDSAHIQEFEAEWRNRKGRRAGQPEFEPVYVMQDALDAIELFAPCDYGVRIQLCEGIDIRFTDIGHLLGSASIEVWIHKDEISQEDRLFRRCGKYTAADYQRPEDNGVCGLCCDRVYIRKPLP